MKVLTLRKIAEVTGGELRLSLLDKDGRYLCLDGRQLGESHRQLLGREVSSIVTDSRRAGDGALFGAIVGERADGHSFIPAVFDQGAVCVLAERELEMEDVFGSMSGDGAKTHDAAEPKGPRAWIRVENTVSALGAIAAEYLNILGIPVVGITGSVGKTSTKEMIASVLSVRFRTRKTEGNFNNELGLPLTVFSLEEGDEAAVLEMGVSHFGDMTALAGIARPGRMVITNIGTCHLEYLHDRKGVFRAKTEVFDFMKPGSMVFLNGNDDLLRQVEDVNGTSPVFFGVDSRCGGVSDLSAGSEISYPAGLQDVQCVTVTEMSPLGFDGTECTIHTPKGDMRVRVPVPGIHNCSNAAAAAAVGLSFGMSLDEIRRGIESARTISGRFKIMRSGSRTVIDDCYNANPVSMKSSLRVLKGAEGRRCAVLGDMGELGEDEVRLHEDVGAYAAQCADHLVAIGNLSKAMYESALRQRPGMSAVWYGTVEEFLADAKWQILDNDTVLVKASHFMQFGRIVEALT